MTTTHVPAAATRPASSRQAVLEAVAYGAERFLAARSWEDVILDVLGRLAVAVDASRATVFTNSRRADGTVMHLRAEWLAPGVESVASIAESDELLLFDRWARQLERGEVVRHVVSREVEVLAVRDVRSTLLVPVVAGGAWAGEMAFDDCVRERDWSPEEAEALRAAAATLGAAIARDESQAELRSREAILEAVAFASRRFLGGHSWEVEIDEVLARLGMAAQANRAILTEVVPDGTGLPRNVIHFEWTDGTSAPALEDPLLQSRTVCPAAFSALSAGRAHQSLTSELPPGLREEYLDLGALSLAAVPVMVDGRLWGSIGFTAPEPRLWGVTEIETLEVAATTVGAAIERELRERELREANARFHAVANVTNTAGFEWRRPEPHLWATGLEAFGYAPGEVVRDFRWLLDRVHPEDRERVESEIRCHLAHGETAIHVECRFRTQDGDYRDVWARALVIADERGIPARAIGGLTDVTERTLMQSALRRRDAILEAVAESAELLLGSAVWSDAIDAVLARLGEATEVSGVSLFKSDWRPDGTITSSHVRDWAAPGVTSQLGSRDVEEVVNSPAAVALARVLDTGAPVAHVTEDFDEPIRSYLAAIGCKSMLILPVFVGGGRWGALSFEDYVAAREWNPTEVETVRVAGALLGTAIQREHVEAQLAAERERERLLDAERARVARLHELDVLKDHLLATVSHELRTPLTSILGFSELLLSRPFATAETERFLSIVHAEATRLTRLVEEFLDLQRIEEGRFELDRSPLNLAGLLEGAVELYRRQSDRHEIVLDLDGSPAVCGDHDRIAQVVGNLLSNAIRYSPDGGEVRVSAAEIDGGVVRIAVTDHGVGIAARDRDRIFDKFFRADAFATRGVGGTGLGLALAREIVDAHGGRIGVSSEEGRGSTFWFELRSADGPGGCRT